MRSSQTVNLRKHDALYLIQNDLWLQIVLWPLGIYKLAPPCDTPKHDSHAAAAGSAVHAALALVLAVYLGARGKVGTGGKCALKKVVPRASLCIILA